MSTQKATYKLRNVVLQELQKCRSRTRHSSGWLHIAEEAKRDVESFKEPGRICLIACSMTMCIGSIGCIAFATLSVRPTTTSMQSVRKLCIDI
jgi:hypothetical protein